MADYNLSHGRVTTYDIYVFITALSWLTITLAMGGKFFATITFFVVYLITAELFPTVLRTSVIGVCSMAGRTGSIASAYVGEIVSLLILMAVVVIWRL